MEKFIDETLKLEVINDSKKNQHIPFKIDNDRIMLRKKISTRFF